jgi:osmotically inducible lipoprotein OsmB
MKRIFIPLVAAGSLLLSGCATLAGAGIGAGAGAVAAGATGGNVKKGAVIGGATGAVVGTVVH